MKESSNAAMNDKNKIQVISRTQVLASKDHKESAKGFGVTAEASERSGHLSANAPPQIPKPDEDKTE